MDVVSRVDPPLYPVRICFVGYRFPTPFSCPLLCSSTLNCVRYPISFRGTGRFDGGDRETFVFRIM